MKINKEDITVCFVTLERAAFLMQSLASLGPFPNIIVHDNGTKNKNNRMIILAQAMRYHAIFHQSENEGLPKAWNQCIINSNTDWVVLCPDDIIFRNGWLEDVNKILAIRPNTKMIFGNNSDMTILHKSIIPTFGWLDERYKQYPSSEDYDLHCRLTEILGFSPYTMPGDHVQGPERQLRLTRKTTKDQFLAPNNFTYWCNSEFSEVAPLCEEIPHAKTADYFEKDPSQETGYDFHAKKWKVCDEHDPGALLNIDGQYWKRLMPDEDPHPEVTEEYRIKYGKT
jgi:hypothetical protein